MSTLSSKRQRVSKKAQVILNQDDNDKHEVEITVNDGGSSGSPDRIPPISRKGQKRFRAKTTATQSKSAHQRKAANHLLSSCNGIRREQGRALILEACSRLFPQKMREDMEKAAARLQVSKMDHFKAQFRKIHLDSVIHNVDELRDYLAALEALLILGLRREDIINPLHDIDMGFAKEWGFYMVMRLFPRFVKSHIMYLRLRGQNDLIQSQFYEGVQTAFRIAKQLELWDGTIVAKQSNVHNNLKNHEYPAEGWVGKHAAKIRVDYRAAALQAFKPFFSASSPAPYKPEAVLLQKVTIRAPQYPYRDLLAYYYLTWPYEKQNKTGIPEKDFVSSGVPISTMVRRVGEKTKKHPEQNVACFLHEMLVVHGGASKEEEQQRCLPPIKNFLDSMCLDPSRLESSLNIPDQAFRSDLAWWRQGSTLEVPDDKMPWNEVPYFMAQCTCRGPHCSMEFCSGLDSSLKTAAYKIQPFLCIINKDKFKFTI